jgi:nicotinamidase-related amidase
MNIQFLCVDLQNDFATEGGEYYTPKASVKFLKETLFPFLKQRNIEIGEIISDYRQPRPGDRGVGCVPAEWGYESIVPKEIVKSQWIKCMNSPIWTRENIGDSTRTPGLPYQNPKAFNEWLEKTVGKPGKSAPVLFGLTIDCCVLSTLQELSWRGYYPMVLKEGVDHHDGAIENRDLALTVVASNWAKIISWQDLQKEILA